MDSWFCFQWRDLSWTLGLTSPDAPKHLQNLTAVPRFLLAAGKLRPVRSSCTSSKTSILFCGQRNYKLNRFNVMNRSCCSESVFVVIYLCVSVSGQNSASEAADEPDGPCPAPFCPLSPLNIRSQAQRNTKTKILSFLNLFLLFCPCRPTDHDERFCSVCPDRITGGQHWSKTILLLSLFNLWRP